MSRRVRTLLVGGVLFVVLFVVAITMPVPYVVLSPGPTYNTLGVDDRGSQIIVIKGRQANAISGHLNMTTVDVSSQHVTAFQALLGWVQHDRVVIPRSAVYPPGRSEKQINQQDTEQFAQSQDAATIAASCELGYPKAFGVISVDSKLGATDIIKAGDRLVSVDGKPADTAGKLKTILEAETVGKTVPVVLKRNGTQQTVSVKLSAPASGSKGARLGVSVSTTCLVPFEVDLGLGDQIGGPSAGLMFALGIMDKVGSVDLTNGRFIAGTGEIQPDGKVLPIGGIQLKMIAARKAGAIVFLAPAGNCSDVKGAIPSGLNVVKVASLHEAVTDLVALKENTSVPHC